MDGSTRLLAMRDNEDAERQKGRVTRCGLRVFRVGGVRGGVKGGLPYKQDGGARGKGTLYHYLVCGRGFSYFFHPVSDSKTTL